MNSYILLLPIFIQQVTSLLESSGRLLKSDASGGSHHTENNYIHVVKSDIETQPRTLVWSGTIPTPGNRKPYVPRVIHDLDVNDQDLVIHQPLITINSLGDNEIVELENVSNKYLQVKLVNTVKARSFLLPRRYSGTPLQLWDERRREEVHLFKQVRFYALSRWQSKICKEKPSAS
ncbi:hypothetical protein PSTT_03039 [Puccinia striiformis]|uniref:Uncharacterized protein n=1 Tax=Puccinia striiformis TaxID=27350 RepID=A0A2S4VXY7_9BASI|nr:hypothetical protein PSTT_03039 [Puccinia striiformis]